MQGLLMLSGLVGMLTIGGSVSAEPWFLTLPFPGGQNATTGDAAMGLQQGWIYTEPFNPPRCKKEDPLLNCGIDYIEGTVGGPATGWQHFPVVAAYQGEACGDNENGGGCVTGQGKRVLIRHDLGNGEFVYTYYDHLNWIAPSIPIGDRNHRVFVDRGEQIGSAGDTGAPGWVHLHFGLTPATFAWLDPYGIYKTRNYYPDPDGTNGLRSGPSNNYWIGPAPDPSPVASYAPGLGRNYGGVYNLDGYCHSLGFVRARLDGRTAYDWHCLTTSGVKMPIFMTSACNWQYSGKATTSCGQDGCARGLAALTKNYYDVNSWRCYGDVNAFLPPQ